MAKQVLALGALANDGTGDTLRDAGTKIQANFDELYLGANSVDPSVLTTTTGTIVLTDYSTVRFNPSAVAAKTLPAGTFDGQTKKIVNIATNAAFTITLTGTFAVRGAQPASPVIPIQTVATCEWYSGKWYVSFNNREFAQI